MSDAEPAPDDGFDVSLDLSVLVGVWADGTHVHRGRSEFTIDFVRHVPTPPRRVLVARVLMAPVVGADLRDRLDDAWRAYLDWSMPEERR